MILSFVYYSEMDEVLKFPNLFIQSPNTSGKGYRLLSAHNIKRPQLKFKDKVDNASKPFVPILRTKPNALKSLAGKTIGHHK